MTYDQLGRMLLFAGVGVLVVGLVFLLIGKTPLGRLPGDISFSTGPVSCFVPVASMILLSVILTIVVNVVLRIMNR